ncbi:GAF sensor hybrid histidine kinase [Fibrisoma limi BUZ 3]|uniref:histidine kinase n=1 Tax=Fibrisoma limi BUZ 3 TaxID=1185876 RepID=I2GCC1_9BACT|nr:response regulator [Fibrisoma limi]CCH51545.1 GAF sensor hybrid histidine kinase [Fibrisoma limi BUZ 3]
MPPNATSNSIIRQLQVVFSLSTILLLLSLVASFVSIQRLISNSELVNHTNEVLIESENIISYMKDAETGQRGYLVTLDPVFLQPYDGSYEKVVASFNRLGVLMADNAVQQKNLAQLKALFEAKFDQMQKVIDLTRAGAITGRDTARRYREMVRGKQVMDDLRSVVNQIKAQENRLLQVRTDQQQVYITYTPILLVITALISMLITGFAYVRIKRDMDVRLAEQQKTEEQYVETNRRIGIMEGITRKIADGDYAVRSTDTEDDELGRIATALNKMAASLERTFTDLKSRNWLQTGAVAVSDAIRGEKDPKKLASRVLAALAEYMEAPLATMYIIDNDRNYRLAGSYAVQKVPPVVSIGEGLVGQVIERKKTVVVQDVPADYRKVSSSLGEATPVSLIISPLVYDGVTIGAIELGMLRAPTSLDVEFVEANRETMSIGVNAALDYGKMQHLLEETQAQAEELQVQHSELENLNTELEMQAQRLQASEEELRVQQEELQQTNAELEERGLLLEEKNDEIQKKADELELATRYKSEFLANMSHELRTPLNSILLLSRLLAENMDENLTSEQVEYARVIQSSGNGLLGLIDEILDLSKIEAGQMKLEYERIPVSDIADEMQALFGIMAQEKGLQFGITVAPDVPAVIEVDKMRLGQILKNLLSNALKFTAKGSVTLAIKPENRSANRLCFIVKDTGIGIPPEKQPLIFEAFQQADGSTKRKYGGTGLGLSISRELAKLLGGEITLNSRVDAGSEFTLIIPIVAVPGAAAPSAPAPAEVVTHHVQKPPVHEQPSPNDTPVAETKKYISPTIPEPVPDDRQTITEQDKIILIVEDDTNFAKSLLEFARKKGYKGVVAVRGDEGLRLAAAYRPIGILLDIQLPIMSGWEVMDALKANPQTRPIPVHIMSSHKLKNESLLKGAIDFVDKPVAFEQMQEVFGKIEYVLNRDTKKVLIIEDNPKHAKALAYFLESFNINSELRSDISEGITALKRREVDCVILDMGIPDNKAYDALEEARKNPELENLPIIIFTGKSLSLSEELRIKKYADSIIVKTAHSYQRMLDEVSLFLHLVEENKSAANTNGTTKKLGALTQVLSGKTVLVADDDVRNIFSMSKALEQYNMTVVAALDGKEALQRLEENPTVDVVLLDMMMPQMDGYETARKIREQYRFRNLPVIAVTAKAMTGDREKCIQAGASDYITKPVDIDQLISLLRVWLYER